LVIVIYIHAAFRRCLQPTYRQYNEEANTKGRPHSTQYQRPRTLELQQQHSAPPGGMPGSRNLHGQSPGHVALLRGVVTWERFLPAGYRTILARADHLVDFTSTKKELFLTLAQDHVILDQGTKVRSELLVNCWPGYLGIG